MSKLNVLLAKTDHLSAVYRGAIADFTKFFKGSQDAFKGERKTFIPAPGTIDSPGKRSNRLVQTTVDEKLDYFEDVAKEFIDATFSLEKTNSSGTAKAILKVDGESWGEFTSLELLRLKSLLEDSNFTTMLTEIPVRSDSEEWKGTSDDTYKGKPVFESPKIEGKEKTTTKEAYILQDPNIGKIDGAKYVAQVAQKDTISELGDYTYQKFSGEWSHRQRAEVLKNKSKLLLAVIEALKVANEVEAVPSTLTTDRVFSYLLG